MNVLVIGNGGRENAIVWKLLQSTKVSKIYCSPGNGGTAELAENVPYEGVEAAAEFAASHKIDLTVIGPEVYLAEGIVDHFRSKGLLVYGPTKAAAQLESSKAFSKDFMKKYNIPTAAYENFDNAEAAKAYIKAQGAPIVVKADGLAAGKGVVVAMDEAAALNAVDEIMTDKIFGSSGARVVIEEFMEGEEASLLAFCDGKIAVPMLPAQDHKRIGDGDTGPNTGGMGTYAPTTVVTDEISQRIVDEILNPTMQAMQAEGMPFVGTLFLGLMLTAKGPRLIEYNVRFGDPETQSVLSLLDSDLFEIFYDAAQGRLDSSKVVWKTGKTAVCVAIASGGYPGKYRTGLKISGLKDVVDSTVFHAGTKLDDDGAILTNGGRVLNVVCVADNIERAIVGAYADVKKIHFDEMYYRQDIAQRELRRFLQ